jgi:hypothetical protein
LDFPHGRLRLSPIQEVLAPLERYDVQVGLGPLKVLEHILSLGEAMHAAEVLCAEQLIEPLDLVLGVRAVEVGTSTRRSLMGEVTKRPELSARHTAE